MQPFTSNSDYKGTQKPPLTISQPDHDLNEILHHIQSSLPDLNMLISRFHEASGRFNARESFVYRTEAQQAENLRQRDMHIERLLQDIEHKTHKHSVESDRLRSIIFGLEKERKELRDKMFAASNSHELTESTEHGGSIRNEDKEHTNEDETTTPVRSPEDIVTRPRKGHVSFKNDGLKDLSLTTVESPHMKQRKLLEFHSSSEQSEPKTESEWLTERKSLEEKLTIQRDVFEKETKTLHMRIKELEKRATYAEEIHTRQPNSLAQTLNEQRDELNHHWERLFQEMTTHHQKELEENHMTWQDRYDRFATNHRKQMQDMQRAVEIVEEKHHKSCNDLEEENEKLRANTENIRATWTAERSKFLKITNELKAVAVKLNEEKVWTSSIIERMPN